MAYLHLQYEFKLKFRDILAKKTSDYQLFIGIHCVINIPPCNVEEAIIGALAGIAGQYNWQR